MHQIHNKQFDVSLKAHKRTFQKYPKTGSVGLSDAGSRGFKTRDLQMTVVRNKFTKEVVDIEVGTYFCIFIFGSVPVFRRRISFPEISTLEKNNFSLMSDLIYRMNNNDSFVD